MQNVKKKAKLQNREIAPCGKYSFSKFISGFTFCYPNNVKRIYMHIIYTQFVSYHFCLFLALSCFRLYLKNRCFYSNRMYDLTSHCPFDTHMMEVKDEMSIYASVYIHICIQQSLSL